MIGKIDQIVEYLLIAYFGKHLYGLRMLSRTSSKNTTASLTERCELLAVSVVCR